MTPHLRCAVSSAENRDQDRATSAEPRPDGALGDTQLARHLGNRQAEPIVEYKGFSLWPRQLSESSDQRQPIRCRRGHLLKSWRHRGASEVLGVVGGEVSHDSSRPSRRLVIITDPSPPDPCADERLLSQLLGDLHVAGQRESEPDELWARLGEELVVVRRPRPAHRPHNHLQARAPHRAAGSCHSSQP